MTPVKSPKSFNCHFTCHFTQFEGNAVLLIPFCKDPDHYLIVDVILLNYSLWRPSFFDVLLIPYPIGSMMYGMFTYQLIL